MKTRRGFSLVELLIVVGIVGMLVGILLPAIQKVRDAAKRTQCENNLRQLGISLHAFHDANRKFPANGSSRSVFVDLLPHCEQGNQVAAWETQGPLPVPLFLCPVRRDPNRAGARVDYVGADNFNGQAILGGKAVSIDVIVSRDGTSNTIMMAHKAMSHHQYDGAEGWDVTWNVSEDKNIRRQPTRITQDRFVDFELPKGFSSAHGGRGSSVLMGDGAIFSLVYNVEPSILQDLCNYDGRRHVALSDDLPTVPPPLPPPPPPTGNGQPPGEPGEGEVRPGESGEGEVRPGEPGDGGRVGPRH